MPLVSARTLGVLACLVNFGLLAFNVFFTRAAALAALDANCFSPFGQMMILVWGLAFLMAGLTEGSSLIWFAFVVEKSCYVANYVAWHSNNSVQETWLNAHKSILYSDDLLELLPPVFVAIYGPVDFLFLLAFLSQFLASLAKPKPHAS